MESKFTRRGAKIKIFFYLCDSKAEYLTKPDKKRHEKNAFYGACCGLRHDGLRDENH